MKNRSQFIKGISNATAVLTLASFQVSFFMKPFSSDKIHRELANEGAVNALITNGHGYDTEALEGRPPAVAPILTKLPSVPINICNQFLDEDVRLWSEVASIAHDSITRSFHSVYEVVSKDFYEKGHYKWLLELGFRFPDGKMSILVVPHLSEIIKNYNSIIKKQIKMYNLTHPRNEHLKNEDIISIGFEFGNDKGQYLTLKFGAPIPKGYTFSGRFTPGQKLYKSLSQGLFPLSFGEFIFHDLAHITGYLEHPNYMAAYKKVAKFITSKFNGLIAKNHIGLYGRVSYFNESLVLVSKEQLNRHLQFFLLPEEVNFNKNGFDIFLQILSKIQELNSEELIVKVEDFLKIVPNLVLELGGGSRDGVLSAIVPDEFHQVNRLIKTLESTIESLRKNQDKKKISRNSFFSDLVDSSTYDLRIYFAKFQTALFLLSKISPHDWAELIIKEKYTDSIVSDFFKVISIYPTSSMQIRLSEANKDHTDGW